MKTTTIKWKPFSQKHKRYIKNALKNKMSVAEGAIRSGKTIDHCIIACMYLEICEDKIHLASGSTIANAKMNIGDCNMCPIKQFCDEQYEQNDVNCCNIWLQWLHIGTA